MRVVVGVQVCVNQPFERRHEVITALLGAVLKVGEKHPGVVPAKAGCLAAWQFGVDPGPELADQFFLVKGTGTPKAGMAKWVLLQAGIHKIRIAVCPDQPWAAISQLFILLPEQGL